MARTSQGLWEERLEELHCRADPKMDELVHRYYRAVRARIGEPSRAE
jgi:hypothetical protein